jgi:hypothetical protein
VSVELARAYTEAMEAHEFGALPDLVDGGVVVVTPKGTVLEGVEAIQEYYSGSGYDYLDATTESHDFQVQDGGVRDLALQVYRWKETGEEAYSRTLETRYDFRDGKIARVEMRLLDEGQP